ncbi:MAG: DUF2927 domain-containing protein [Defluviicoccus sp.]
MRKLVGALPVCVVLAVTGLSLPAHSQSPYAPLPPFEAVVDQFVDVAFSNEHGPSRGIVQKWSVPPTMGFFARPDYDAAPHLTRFDGVAAEIADLTGLALELTPKARPVSLRVGFYPRSDFHKLPIAQDTADVQRFLNTSACVALTMTTSGTSGEIGTGAIVIGTDISPGLQRHCILEEFVQVLGLPNDACHYRPSLFCEDDMVNDMTPADQILLKALYDDRIVAGTRRDNALPLVRQVIFELYGRFETSRSVISTVTPRL